MIERIPITSRDQWLALRKQDVTASVVGALRNIHPWTSRFHLYKEKAGFNVGEVKVNVRMRRGLRIERAVAAMVMEDNPSWSIEPAGVYLRNPARRIGATPDFFMECPDEIGRGVVQTKITTYRNFKKQWMDDDGALMVPPWIVLQTTTEMMMAEADFGYVAVFIDDAWNPLEQDLFLFRLDRHAAGEARIYLDVAEFWDDVANQREPEVDPKLDADLVRLLYSESNDLLTCDLSGDNYLPGALRERADLKEEIERLKGRIEEIDTYTRGKMGMAELGFGNGFTVTLKTVKRAGYIVPPVSFRQLRVKGLQKEITTNGEQITF